MCASSTIPALTESDLLVRGYFHDRMVPPLSTRGLGPAVPDLTALTRRLMQEAAERRYRNALLVRSRCVTHSVPKRKHLRRILSIPNPLHQSALCCETVDHWRELYAKCKESRLSLTCPKASKIRALQFEHDRQSETQERARRSVASRYVLRTDLARFYPSIYTHSIGWAVHGKTEARADTANAFFGNRLDLWTRETQDRQTGGIPIGPDTSYLLAEVIASRLDLVLQTEIGPNLRGTRYVDDYNLYFDNLSEAEKALAVLHGAARQFELEINDLKTRIMEVPEPLEPSWKTQLRGMELREHTSPTALKALFDRASELAKEHPQDSVLTYVAKMLLTAEINPEHWELCEVLLLRSTVGEPGLMASLLKIYEKYDASPSIMLQRTLESLCKYHSPLHQGNEIAWSLWTARALGMTLPDEVAKAVRTVDDDIVALIALDMMALGLMPHVETPVWDAHMNLGGLYSEHWLLAYEAFEQGWRRPAGGADYIAADPYGCFPILRRHKVRFYDPEIAKESEFDFYGETDDEEEDFDEAKNDEVFPFESDLGI
jgi:hypothetical protein